METSLIEKRQLIPYNIRNDLPIKTFLLLVAFDTTSWQLTVAVTAFSRKLWDGLLYSQVARTYVTIYLSAAVWTCWLLILKSAISQEVSKAGCTHKMTISALSQEKTNLLRFISVQQVAHVDCSFLSLLSAKRCVKKAVHLRWPFLRCLKRKQICQSLYFGIQSSLAMEISLPIGTSWIALFSTVVILLADSNALLVN